MSPRFSAFACRSRLFALAFALSAALPPLVGETSSAGAAVDTRPGSAAMPLKALESPLPALLPGEKRIAPVRLGVWVKEDGTVDSVEFLNDNPKWHAEVLRTIQAWKFEPIEYQGKRIPARTEVTFLQFGKSVSFSQSPLPNFPDEIHAEGEFGLRLPMVSRDPDIYVPILKRATRGTLEAGFEFVVEKDGLPAQLTLLGANSESSYRAVVNQVANLEYKPGTVRGEPVRVKLRQVTSLVSNEQPPEALTGLVYAMDPVYPYEQLVAGTGGSAKVRFNLDAEGQVARAEVLEASQPEFGLALKATIESWLFSPEAAALQSERVYEHEFSPEGLPGGVARLVALARKGRAVSGFREGLSGSPKRAYSPPLAYPPEMLARKQAGSAVIEFVVDRAGLAQVPRIVKASDPVFGWAAATWIGSMRFEPLSRGGLPADLRLTVPVNFTPPAQEGK